MFRHRLKCKIMSRWDEEEEETGASPTPKIPSIVDNSLLAASSWASGVNRIGSSQSYFSSMKPNFTRRDDKKQWKYVPFGHFLSFFLLVSSCFELFWFVSIFLRDWIAFAARLGSARLGSARWSHRQPAASDGIDWRHSLSAFISIRASVRACSLVVVYVSSGIFNLVTLGGFKKKMKPSLPPQVYKEKPYRQFK